MALAFPKFFNINEHESTKIENLPDEQFYSMEKMDGSLGIVYYYDYGWRVNTRGSFNGEQAQEATKMLQMYNTEEMNPDWTYLVEIIYPENKIIVPYGNEKKLVLLAARNKFNGEYADKECLSVDSCDSGIPLAKTFNYTIDEMMNLKTTESWKNEGWVVVYESGLRVKIKTDDYMRLARFKANLSKLTIWEAMKNGTYQEMRQSAPEEFYDEMDEIFFVLEVFYDNLKSKCDYYRDMIDWTLDRKQVALQIQNMQEWCRPILFSNLTGAKPRVSYIYDLIRPKNNEYVNISQYK